MYITSSTRKDKAGHAWLSAASVLLVITLLTMLVPRASAQSDFTLIALPDTQYYSETYPNTFTAQTKWVVDNAAALNIQAVLGLGDIVNTASNTWEWQNADTSIKLLDSANIPYLLAIGNHDYSDSGDSSGRTSETTNFNAFFGPSRYQGYSWYKGQYPAGSNENFYGILTINGKQYLFLMLEFYPRDAALAWATSIIAANPAAEVIVVTHSYVYIDNTRVSLCDSINAQTYNVGADNDGEALWKKFVSQYSQISLVLNGHFAYTDSTAEGVGRRTDLGVNGNIVNEMLSDYQEMTNGGNGYLRILKFRPSLNTIEVSTYSPTLNAYLSDSNNQFTVQWHSTGTPPSGTGTVGGQVQNLSCETISGATVSTGSGSATTDSQGNFSLNATAPAAYTVTAQASGYAPSSDAINVWTGYPDSVKYFLSTQQPGSISGKVTNTSGAAISSATVWYSGGTTKTDSSGDYTFSNVPPETYTVTASQSGYQTSSNQNVSVSSGITTSSNLVLTATSTGSIAGTVTNATGTGIANATVSYSGGSATATTNSSGGYTLNVVPGTYGVTATAVGYLSATQPGVSVAAGATTALNFALTQSGTISGTVTNGAGTGIANATVSYSGGSTTATSNSSGGYTLSVAPGTYSVTAGASGYVSSTQANISVTMGSTATVNFSLAQSIGTISGTVTNATGAGIANATVSYSGGSTTATTNSSGAYTLSVAPGTYSVTAAASGYVSSTPQNFSVTAGSTTVANFSLAASGGTAMATVQSANKSQSGLTSLSLAFPVTPTAGNTLIVVGISSGVLGTSLTVSDNNLQTWQSAFGYVTNPSTNGQVKVWFASNCVGKPTTVTVSIGSASHNIHMQIFEVSGLTTNPVDATGSSDSGSASVTTQSVTTTGAVTQGTEYALATHWTWNCSSCAPTITKDPNYTILQQSPNPSGGDFVLSEARVQSVASGKQSVTFSSSIAYQYASVLITFKGGSTGQNGVIGGNVTNATGTGIANATVSYSGGSATATTNSSGGYTLNVVPGTYSVTATAVGYLSATQPGVSVAAGATTALNFALTQSGTISGTVTNGAGTGIANATVSYSGGSTTATSNSSGGYTLSVAPGTYSVTAGASGYVSSTQANISVTMGSTATVNFSLAQSIGTISGTVTNATGAGIANATVSYSGGSTTATTNSSGAYTLSVAPGTYSVTAAASGYVSSTPQNFSVTAGSTTVANFSLAASGGTAMATVQSANKSQSGLTSLSLAFPVTPTAGNTLIVVGISSGVLGTSLTVSDNNLQTWQSAFGYVTNPSTNGQVKVWFASNCVGKPTTVTVSIGSASHNIHMQIFEVSGLTTNPVDATGSSDSGSASVTTQSVTTTGAVTQGTEYALATHWTWNCSSCAPTITKDPNYTILQQSPNPSGGDFVLSEARVQSVASGKQSVTFSSSIAYQYASVLITFK